VDVDARFEPVVSAHDRPTQFIGHAFESIRGLYQVDVTEGAHEEVGDFTRADVIAVNEAKEVGQTVVTWWFPAHLQK
jgi:hypothetical protein